jgi:hypothetical protein
MPDDKWMKKDMEVEGVVEKLLYGSFYGRGGGALRKTTRTNRQSSDLDETSKWLGVFWLMCSGKGK